MQIVIKDTIPNKGKKVQDLNLFYFNNIEIIDNSSGIYSCDILIQTWSFKVELFDTFITEIEFLQIKNDLIAFLKKKVPVVEFEQMEAVFKIRIEKNRESKDLATLFIDAHDLYYGTMSIKTSIKYDSLTELIKQFNENIEPIHKELWSMSNQEIKEYLVKKWRQEGFLKSD